MSPNLSSDPLVVVTGANGLVGSRVCHHLIARGATVRAIVRRAGASPKLPGLEEVVGDFYDPDVAARACSGASALVTTVHPLGGDDEEQRTIAVEGTPVIVRAARDAKVPVAVHVSTAAVYDRSPGMGDVDEHGSLVSDDANIYAVTKRDTDAAIEQIDGLTRVAVRPPAIVGESSSSVWNTIRPQAMASDEHERHANPDGSWAWVHVDDLASLIVDVVLGDVPVGDDVDRGPIRGDFTVLNAAAEPATQRHYVGTVCEALGVEPVWTEEPAWTGSILADRARAWGWRPSVTLDLALTEIASGLRD